MLKQILDHPYINKSAIAADLFPNSSSPSAAMFARIKRNNGNPLKGDETDIEVFKSLNELKSLVHILLKAESERVKEELEKLERVRTGTTTNKKTINTI